jgi:hypothetical protein
MPYIIQKIEFKTSASGNKYARATIDGKEVAIFDKFPNFSNLKEGDSVEGDMTKKEYQGKDSWTLNPLARPSSFKSGGNGNIAKLQEKKAEGIKQSQENRAEGVKVASTFRDATLITVAMLNKSQAPDSIDKVQEEWLYWRDWLWKNWDVEEPPFK